MHMYTARVSAAALLILLALGLPLKAAAQTLMDTVIVFSSDRDGDYEIHSVRQDASELSQLTTNTGDDDAPEVSPDGTRIAFHSDRSGNYDIWAMDLSGANAVNLSQDDGVDKFPAWSPDGSRIAFMSTRDGSENIWVMGSLVGDVPTAVTGTSAPVRNNHPDWSLTGEIAFDSDRANQGWLSIWWAVEDASVWSMLPQLVSDEESMYPAWSADGSALAYKSQTPNPIALRSVSIVDGIPGTPISVVSGDVKLCDWSPDGAKIVYSNGGDIYVVDSDGLNAGLLESDSESTSEKSPSWSPYLIAPEISVLPPSLDFGDVQILQPAMEILTVTSTGAATLTVSDITSDNAAFTVAPDTAPLPFDLAAADPDLTETVTVTFTPTVEGAQSANITITHNAADSPTVVTVTGSGAVPPSITIAAPTAGQQLAAGTTTTDIAVDVQGNPAPGHWAWRLDAPFPDSGPAGATSVVSGVTDTIPDLTDGDHAVYVALVDGAGDLLAPSVHQSVAFFVGTPTAPAGGALLTVATRRGQAGATVSVPIDTTSLDTLDIGSISLSLAYDPELLTPVTANTSLGILDPAAWTLEQHVIAPGQLNLSMAAAFGSAAGAGPLVTVDFAIEASAPDGASTSLQLTRADLNEGIVPSAALSGTFSVMQLVYGDVSGNGVPTAYDAAWILEYVVTQALGEPVLFPIEVTAPVWSDQPVSHAVAVLVADVDASGTDISEDIAAPDASLLLQYDVGLIAAFPAESGVAAPTLVPLVADIGLRGAATSSRPGARLIITLDASAMAGLQTGELVLGFDGDLLEPVAASLRYGGERNQRPLLSHRAADGRLAVAFASARPIEGPDAVLDVTFETSRSISTTRESAIRASHLRLNGSRIGTDFAFPFRIEPFANRLLANYPNPFNPETWIPFELSAAADVTIRIYGLGGDLVRRLELGSRPIGEHVGREDAAYWDGRNARGEAVASGVYVYELTAGDYHAVRRMVVMK